MAATTAPRARRVHQDYYKINQHDFSVIWPVVPQWSVIARWQHDYSRSRTLEAFGGFEYDSCCWKLRLINRYWIDYDETSLNPTATTSRTAASSCRSSSRDSAA